MSWNPAPTIGGANWQGSQTLATKNQLLSSVSGLYNDIQDIGLSSITVGDLKVSTLTVANWLSAPIINVCTLHAQAIDISGVALDPSGVIVTNAISANQALFNLQILSTLEFKQTIQTNINVSLDLHVGEAISGALTGLGFLLFEALLGLGAGIGAALQGLGNGLAAMIWGRGGNTTYINNNNYELLGGSTQLQVSTLGNTFPVYSSIMRLVSSSGAGNQVPGKEIFVSTLFYPGQICIRSVSDPQPMMTINSNINTSTMQQFGEWVPLTGLEPENIIGNSVSTNFLSSGNAYIDLARIEDVIGYSAQFSNIGVQDSLSLNYIAPLNFATGTPNSAAIVGYLNNLYFYTTTGFIFSAGGAQQNAALQLGQNSHESILTVSSIFSQGSIQTQTLYASSITAESLTVISSVNVTNTNVANVTSTQIIEANKIYANFADISTLAPFFFSSSLGNPNGPFDIAKYDSIVSTSYNQVSSLQQNILNYSLNIAVQDEPSFNIGDPGPLGVTYSVTPANISQWASTQIVFNGYQGPGGIDLGWVGQWGVTPGDVGGAAPGGATFDVFYGPSPVQQYQYSAPFYLTEQSNRSYPVGLSTFYQQPNPNLPYPVTFTARMTLPPIVGGTRSGWWQMTTPCPAPYQTSNNNTFQIYQDINDTYITATDRLHLQAGDILLDGALGVSNLNIQNATITNLTGGSASFLTVNSVSSITSNLYATQFVSSPTYLQQYTFSGPWNTPGPATPLNFQYQLNSTDFTNIRNLNVPSRGPNLFNSLNVGEWSNTQFNTPVGTNTTTGAPAIYLGDLVKTSGYSYGPAKFWINNTTSGPVIPCPVYVVKTGGWLSTIGVASGTGTGYTLIQTPDGVNWSLTPSVPQPQGLGGVSFSNTYTLQLNQQATQLNVGMPYTEQIQGTKTVLANKIIHAANQIRTITYNSPSYPPREAGFELTTYFDANVVFLSGQTQSDAINNIISPAGSLGYAVQAWSPQLWFGRIRTESFGIQGMEIEAVVSAVSGTFGDIIWASHRYLNVTGTAGSVSANIREIYFMVPMNYMTYDLLIGPY